MAARRRRREWLEWPFSDGRLFGASGVDGAQDHARQAWRHAAWLTRGLPVGRRTVDGDLEFLKTLARHVEECQRCRARHPDGRPEDWLWRAVRADRGLRQLAEPLDRGGDGGG